LRELTREKFISLLGGQIGWESAVDQGTLIWFAVSCGRPAPDSKITMGPKENTLSKTMGIVVHVKDLEPGIVDIVDEDAKVQIEGTVVLLVEDNWANRVVTQRRLERLGCKVICAVNGRDAAGILQKASAISNIDLILMGDEMPLLVCQLPYHKLQNRLTCWVERV
jgi:hypothetical protein